MLFQEIVGLVRVILILIPQPILGIVFLFLAFKILKRRSTRISITLSGFYILLGIAMILNVLFLLLSSTQNSLLLLGIYFFILYFILTAFIFVSLFIIQMNRAQDFTLKTQISIILIYAFLSFLLLTFPNGIKLSSETNWIPIFSWEFLVVFYLYFTIIIVVPTIIYSNKLYHKFKDPNLKKRLRFLISGIFEGFIVIYGTALFNTWQDPLFKFAWSLITVVLLLSLSFFIYYGIGSNL